MNLERDADVWSLESGVGGVMFWGECSWWCCVLSRRCVFGFFFLGKAGPC